MLRQNADSIAAIATAVGRGSVGVVRISGKHVTRVAESILGFIPSPRHATYTSFKDFNGEILDQGIAIYFPSPHSYTGEDILELQGHGGSAVLNLLLQQCLAMGIRLAEPGEFTQRAFLNNKLDLAQAESVADLIDATTTEAARSAIRSLNGDFSLKINSLVDDLIRLRMLVEAMLDFPEEELETIDISRRHELLKVIRFQLESTLLTARQGSLLREGAHVALVGRPNVGKSSLLNRLSGEEVALVSEIAGTTRDVIRQSIQINGVPLHIMDTAGLRDSQDEVENMGMERTHKTLQRADLILLLIEATQGCNSEDYKILSKFPPEIPRLLVYNKSDLLESGDTYLDENSIYVSAKNGDGIDLLRKRLLEIIGWKNQDSGIFIARERHLQALRLSKEHLDKATLLINYSELFAEELKLAQLALSSITGKFSADDLLGEIFSRFCIGK